ncbi:MAG TPA: PBP1A family penicillin-binding protein [Thermoanaerobaculia bacterium]|nr:PBP1A family penicillin-binding protein [Thermoanaerobaculia bacterium]
MTPIRYRRGKTVRWELRRRHLWAAGAVAAVGLALLVWLVWPFWSLAGQFGRVPERHPSRMYSAPLVVETGAAMPLEEVLTHLQKVGYREVGEGELLPGELRRTGAGVAVYSRSFPTPRGWTGSHRLEIAFSAGRVASLTAAGKTLDAAQLEPHHIATFYGPDLKERRPVRFEDLPEDLILAVLAAEDARFFEHSGVSPAGILRAAFANVRRGGIEQGGSTLTQQLVKNLFLTHERTVTRKLREMVLALLVDLRYGKEEILEAYLNEIYLGADGALNLMGVGSASWAYFGKHPARLSLGEAATLAGIIPAPSRYDPVDHPEVAKRRRDQVLDRLGELEWVDAERLERAKAAPLAVAPQPIVRRRAPYFVDRALDEARRRYGVTSVADAGYTIVTTLAWPDQVAAAEAVAWGLPELEKGWEKGREVPSPLQAALVSLDPATGAVRAYLGGRDWGKNQYDRAGVGRRQAGSAFKPIVYAAALREGVVTSASLVEDAPLTLQLAGKRWSPQNSDDSYRGWVTVRTALEKSLNVPTVRVAMQTGLEHVVDLARAMGVAGQLQPLPAMALGAFEVSPLELATVYATLASGGIRPGVHAVTGVLDSAGQPVPGAPPPAPVRVLGPDVAFVVTHLLQGVVTAGTGAGVRRMGLRDPLAGKTGTSNESRDSWFAGYSPEKVAVVWVGYDENLPTRLGGARAALPIWARYMAKVRPAAGFADFRRPEGVVMATVDPQTGDLATEACPWRVTEAFLPEMAPREECDLHGSWWGGRDGRDRRRGGGRLKRWLERVFGDEQQQQRYEEELRQYEEDLRRHEEEQRRYEEELRRYEEERRREGGPI